MNYDDYKLMTPEEASPERKCDACDEWFPCRDLDVEDGLELCPGCLSAYLEAKEYEPYIYEDE